MRIPHTVHDAPLYRETVPPIRCGVWDQISLSFGSVPADSLRFEVRAQVVILRTPDWQEMPRYRRGYAS